MFIQHMLSVRQIHPVTGGWLSPQSLGPHNTGAVLKLKMGETQTPPRTDLLLGLIPESDQTRSPPSSWNCLFFFPNTCYFCGDKSLFTSVNSLDLVMAAPTFCLMNSF